VINPIASALASSGYYAPCSVNTDMVTAAKWINYESIPHDPHLITAHKPHIKDTASRGVPVDSSSYDNVQCTDHRTARCISTMLIEIETNALSSIISKPVGDVVRSLLTTDS